MHTQYRISLSASERPSNINFYCVLLVLALETTCWNTSLLFSRVFYEIAQNTWMGSYQKVHYQEFRWRYTRFEVSYWFVMVWLSSLLVRWKIISLSCCCPYRNGSLDLLLSDTPILDYYRAIDLGCNLLSIGDTIVEDTYAIGMKKGWVLFFIFFIVCRVVWLCG